MHHLLIPAIGLMEVWDTEEPLDVEGTLRARHAEGAVMSMTYAHLTIQWFVNNLGPVNQRARETLVEIGGPHTIFTGPVMFSGLPSEEVAKVVAHLSRKE